MLERFRDWLLRIPVLVVCAVAVVLSTVYAFVVESADEGVALVIPPLFDLWIIPLLFGLWFVTWMLALAHAHRAVAGTRSSLVRFGAPIAAAFVFVVCTAYAGHLIVSWFSRPPFPR